MYATIDDNHLLSIPDATLDTGKIYQQTFQGYQISEKNKQVFVLHKKEIKLIELKNIGSTMGAIYIAQRQPFHQLPLVADFVQFAGQHFEGFDEETGERYYFFPAFPLQRIERVNAMFHKLSLSLQLQQTAKGVISPRKATPNLPALPAKGSIEQLLSHFFWLTLLYGKFEIKNAQLNSIKIQVPLSPTYAGLQEIWQQSIQYLQTHGLFLQSSLNTQQDKTTFQITSNDREVLQIFAHWYKPIENSMQITKREQAIQVTQQILTFLDQAQIENSKEIWQIIQESVVKILVK